MGISKMNNNTQLVWTIFGAISITFHLSLIFYGLVPNLISRPIHMMLAVPWVLIFSSKNQDQLISGMFITFLAWFSCAYIVINEATLGDQYGHLEGGLQFAVAISLLLVVLETTASDRHIGHMRALRVASNGLAVTA